MATLLMFLRNLIFCLSFLFFIPTSGFSQLGRNKTYEFLNLPVSARVSSLGGALISTRDNDLNVSLTNPALLTDTMNNNIGLSFVNYFADINYGYVGYAKNINKNQNLSVGIQYLDYGKFNNTDEFGNINGTFGANEMSFNVSYARSLFDSNLTLGTTLKTIYSHLNTFTSIASAIDLGGVYVFPKNQFTIAAVIKNAGVQWKSYIPNNHEQLPFEMQIGCSKKLKHSPFRFSLTYKNLEKWILTDSSLIHLSSTSTTKATKLTGFGDKLMRHIVIGGELVISKNFFIRAGYNYQRRQELKIAEKKGMTGFSVGFGVRIYKFHLSYGRAIYSLAGASNNFSLSVDLNSFYQKKLAH